MRRKQDLHQKNQPAAGAAKTLTLPVGLPEGYAPTRQTGLTAAEAAARAEAGQANRAATQPGKTTAQILRENLFTLFNLLNFALAFCLALVGSWRNMLFLGVVFWNTLIGTVQSLRARAMLNKLRLLQEKPCHPIRDGAETDCAPDDLVLGDLVIFRAGDQLPADAIVRAGSCAADESLLTGESDPVRREPGDWLMSGSFLTEGRVTAQLAAVGDDSYAARLMGDARRIRTPRSELMTDLNRLVGWISRLLVPPAGAAGASALCPGVSDPGCSHRRSRPRRGGGHDWNDPGGPDPADLRCPDGRRGEAGPPPDPGAGALRN